MLFENSIKRLSLFCFHANQRQMASNIQIEHSTLLIQKKVCRHCTCTFKYMRNACLKALAHEDLVLFLVAVNVIAFPSFIGCLGSNLPVFHGCLSSSSIINCEAHSPSEIRTPTKLKDELWCFLFPTCNGHQFLEIRQFHQST